MTPQERPVRYPNVSCHWCTDDMPKGSPGVFWRRKPYHPHCFTQARASCFTPVPF